MQSIATIETSLARQLLERLKESAISAELRSTADQTGLELSDVLVEEIYYERACDIAESWEAERRALADKRWPRCPKCRERKWEQVRHEKLDYVYRCKNCGCELVF